MFYLIHNLKKNVLSFLYKKYEILNFSYVLPNISSFGFLTRQKVINQNNVQSLSFYFFFVFFC